MAETGSGTTAAMSTSTSSSTATTEDATGSTTVPSTTEGSGTEPGTGSSEGSSTSAEGGGVCDPATQDHPCLECFVDDCCKSWTNCLADEGCTCVIDCHVIKGGSLGNCESQCDSDGELYQAVFFCGQMYCLGTCEWDCC